PKDTSVVVRSCSELLRHRRKDIEARYASLRISSNLQPQVFESPERQRNCLTAVARQRFNGSSYRSNKMRISCAMLSATCQTSTDLCRLNEDKLHPLGPKRREQSLLFWPLGGPFPNSN